MKNIIVIGAGGLGQEIVWLIQEINRCKEEWNILGFLDSHPDVCGCSYLGFPVLGKFEDAAKYNNAYFVIAFGDARFREQVYHSAHYDGISWATLISPTVYFHETNRIGEGCVLGRYSDLTIDCEIGKHVMLNIHSVLGHKVKIGDFSIISPNVTITGSAVLGKCCSVGANAFVRDVTIGDYVTIGGSSCVVRPVPDNCVVAGVPAKVIREGAPINRVTKCLR